MGRVDTSNPTRICAMNHATSRTRGPARGGEGERARLRRATIGRTMETCEGDLIEGIASMGVDERRTSSSRIVDLLRSFLGVQQRRAEAYTKLRRYHSNRSLRVGNFSNIIIFRWYTVLVFWSMELIFDLEKWKTSLNEARSSYRRALFYSLCYRKYWVWIHSRYCLVKYGFQLIDTVVIFAWPYKKTTWFFAYSISN